MTSWFSSITETVTEQGSKLVDMYTKDLTEFANTITTETTQIVSPLLTSAPLTSSTTTSRKKRNTSDQSSDERRRKLQNLTNVSAEQFSSWDDDEDDDDDFQDGEQDDIEVNYLKLKDTVLSFLSSVQEEQEDETRKQLRQILLDQCPFIFQQQTDESPSDEEAENKQEETGSVPSTTTAVTEVGTIATENTQEIEPQQEEEQQQTANSTPDEKKEEEEDFDTWE